MTLTLQAEKIPLWIDTEEVARLGNTRVTLDTVITAFRQGDSPEQIIDSFDVLALADVYAVIAYYLNHREEVEVYLRQQEAAADQVRREIEAHRPDMFTLRARLLERKQQR
jgi:uncharacterized protein (DUF433 family)